MPVFKKILFALFITSAIALGVWAYFNLKNNKKPNVDALTVLPDSCLVYLSTVDFFNLDKKLNSQSLIVDKLKLFNDINRFCNTLRQFDSLFSSQPLVKEEITNNTIHLAVYGKDLNWLAAFNVKQLGQQKKVNDEISKLFHANPVEKSIYEFELKKNVKFYFSINNGVVVISNTLQKIHEALGASSKRLCNNPSFLEFKNALEENSLLSVYVNHELYRKSEAIKKLNLPGICRNGFYSGMVDIQPSELKINGYLKPDSLGLVSIFAEQEPQAPDFMGALPFACNYFQAYGFSSLSAIKPRLDQWQSPTEKEFWQVVNDSALYNLNNAFYSNVVDHLVAFESGASRQKFVMLKAVDSTLAMEHLKLMSDSTVNRNANSFFRLKQLQGEEELKLFNPLSDCDTKYAALFGSRIYFSGSEEDLAQLLFNLKSGMIITENASFNRYRAQNFTETFNYLVYSIPSLDKTGREVFFNFSSSSQNDPFENFKHFSFSITNRKNKMEFRWHLLNETESVNKEQNILWALQLDTACNMKARSFVNHMTRENELLVQDEGMKLYLLNAKGTILWKKQLKEKITSELFMVDIFKNNRYQLLFSSRNQLHLIDRNGNYLPGYPLNLPAEASSPLSVFDYDNTRDYRLFIACKNNQVYNYSTAGKRQEGFVTVRTDNKVRLPVQYIKVGKSDYLVALDEEGKIYTFSRRGDGRIGLKNKTVSNCTAFYLDATANISSTYLVYADDKNSLINKISFADKKEIVKLNYDVENATINFCERTDQQTAMIIFTRLNAVIAYDLNGNLLFSRPFDNDLSETGFYGDESRSAYLTRSHLREELLVFDPVRLRTKLFQATALPLVCDLFNDNKKYLVITNGSRLSCALLN
ncbi:MAG: hypothetical protein V4635_08515 [Bacteroidota bacterium]